MRALVECQISNDFTYISARPANSSQLFKVNAHNEGHCVYICVSNDLCHAILYSAPACVCYADHATDGADLDGAVAMRTNGAGKSVEPMEQVSQLNCMKIILFCVLINFLNEFEDIQFVFVNRTVIRDCYMILYKLSYVIDPVLWKLLYNVTSGHAFKRLMS